MFASSLFGSFMNAFKGMFAPRQQYRPGTYKRRSRVVGPVRPAGAKLMKKARQGMLTKCH